MKSIILFLAFFILFFPGRGINNESHTGRSGESSGDELTKYLYLGAETCATKCHNNEEMGHQYDEWKESLHSKSYQSLHSGEALKYSRQAGITGNPWENIICLKCHITAAGFASSSFADTYRKEDGVTCEACHKGEYIPKTFIPKEDDCLICHNPAVHKTGQFDFRKSCRKISHPRPEVKSV
jgi:hypothetical protein